MAILEYSEWNKALFQYFFPTGNEDPILFLDDTILDDIAKRNSIKLHYSTAEEDFLHKVLIDSEGISSFRNDWRTVVNPNTYFPVYHHEDFMRYLMGIELFDIPASFAILCAILCIAGRVNKVKHDQIDVEAEKYLGVKPNHIGAYIDDLMQDLHHFVSSFNPNHTACGNQRHMSRIKYQLVLRGSERDSFIDFVELNNLKWEIGPFTEYVNNILVPALNRAGKEMLVEKVIATENIPYFKNILLKPLNFGKSTSGFGNAIQQKDILWYYELEFDFNGNPTFNIISDYYKPCAITLDGTSFSFSDDGTPDSDIALEVPFSPISAQNLLKDGQNYCIKNISSDWNTLYFKCVGNDIYRQTLTLEPGLRYIRLTRRNLAPFGTQILLGINGYQAEEVVAYGGPVVSGRARGAQVLNDQYDLYGVGSYFRIKLMDGQKLYWQSDTLGTTPIPLSGSVINGEFYFRLPQTTATQICGSIKITQPNKEDYYDHVVIDTYWNGANQLYTLDGWGDVVNTAPTVSTLSAPTGHLTFRGTQIPSSQDHDMLLQILYDLADENGCVKQTDMVEAVDFVLTYNCITSSSDARKHVIYALKSLGYIISYYDSARHSYQNQLVASYLEKTNYSIDLASNAYLVKGVYSKDQLDNLLSGVPNAAFIKYVKPYHGSTIVKRPEYKCLPDQILLQTNRVVGWSVKNHTTADYLIAIMQNMANFATSFNINTRGDVYYPVNALNTPCMVKDSYGKDVLCTKTSAGYVTHKYHILSSGQINTISKGLARTYCQNQRNQPVCLMTQVSLQQKMDYSKFRILEGMGLPLIIDMAFCDLNLGLPEFKEMFVKDVAKVPFVSKSTVTTGRVYQTNATRTDQRLLLEAVKKWSGRNVNDLAATSSVCINSRSIGNYSHLCCEELSNHRKRLLLYNQNLSNQVIAFSEGQKVYAELVGTGNYVEVIGTDVNDKLSSVLNNTFKYNGNAIYTGTIPVVTGTNQKAVEIIY